MTPPYDDLLRQRMALVGIESWSALQDQSGISRRAMDQVRKGSLDTLKLCHIRGLAQSLNWSMSTFLSHFGLMDPTIDSPVESADLGVVDLGAPSGHQVASSTPHYSNSVLVERANSQDPTPTSEHERVNRQQEQDLVRAATLEELRTQLFEHLRFMLINYPSARYRAEQDPQMKASQVVALFRPLDTLLANWGYEPIGTVGETVGYDPQLHEPDQPDVNPLDPVYIRYVGYRKGPRILCPARVSRTLPE